MLSDRMLTALLSQLQAEFASFYLYRSMQAWFAGQNLDGFAHWMQLQALEEMGHAERIITYVEDRGGTVVLPALDAPQATWDTALAAIEGAREHERRIFQRINDLLGVATDENDYSTQTFLHWFVREQVEEESTVDRIVQRMKLAADSPTALFMIDSELGARTNAQ
jgi:ferritin